jgi:Cu(I)/Ag(I) efflux system membrane protein CusA/SilA
MDSAVRMPGVTNAWTMPIQGRNDMLATGIRTPVGIKLFGPDLAVLERLGRQVEGAVQTVAGTRSAFAERAVSGFYLDIDIDRAAAARHGLNVGDVQTVIATAVGGMTITRTVEGRERYGVRIRYPQELRDTPERLASVLVPAMHSVGGTGGGGGGGGMGGPEVGAETRATAYVPLGEIAAIRQVAGPMVVRTEDAIPTAWVYVDVAGRDVGRYVAEAQRVVRQRVTLPVGYSMVWSGQYEYMQRAAATLRVVIPATLALIFLLLFLNFGNVGETLIVMLSLTFARVGGLWFVWALGYNWSVAVAIGFIALAGVAAETGVVMLIYLDHAWKARVAAGRLTARDLYDAVMEGGAERVRPKMMTVTAIMAGLLPILWGGGAGASVMKRIAAPMVGGMVSSTVLTLIVIPAIYSLWKEREVTESR